MIWLAAHFERGEAVVQGIRLKVSELDCSK